MTDKEPTAKEQRNAELIDILQSSTNDKIDTLSWPEQAEKVRAMNSVLIDTIAGAVSRLGWTPELVALFMKASACAKTWTSVGAPQEPEDMTDDQLRKAAQ